MKVVLHLTDGFEEIEAISVIDVLRRADIDVQTVSVTGCKQVTGSHAISVLADVLFAEVDYAAVDMLILPGGPGTKNLSQHEELKTQIRLAAEAGKWLAAICAAPTVLGKMGLLAGKKATCYPGMQEDLTGADTTCGDSVIVDGKIITSRGPGTSLDFAFTLVRLVKGEAVEKNLREKMVVG